MRACHHAEGAPSRGSTRSKQRTSRARICRCTAVLSAGEQHGRARAERGIHHAEKGRMQAARMAHTARRRQGSDAPSTNDGHMQGRTSMQGRRVQVCSRHGFSMQFTLVRKHAQEKRREARFACQPWGISGLHWAGGGWYPLTRLQREEACRLPQAS